MARIFPTRPKRLVIGPPFGDLPVMILFQRSIGQALVLRDANLVLDLGVSWCVRQLAALIRGGNSLV